MSASERPGNRCRANNREAHSRAHPENSVLTHQALAEQALAAANGVLANGALAAAAPSPSLVKAEAEAEAEEAEEENECVEAVWRARLEEALEEAAMTS